MNYFHMIIKYNKFKLIMVIAYDCLLKLTDFYLTKSIKLKLCNFNVDFFMHIISLNYF